MNPKKNRKERITEVVSLTLVSLNWLLFVASASNYSYFWWGSWLLYSRIGAACIGLCLAAYVLVSRTSPANILTAYLTFSMAIQASHGMLEPTSQAEFYSYTGFFFLLAAMAYRGDFSGWTQRWLSVQALLFLMPLWTKDRALITPLRNFVDNFSTPTAALMLGVVMARINSAKHVVLQENLSLKESLLDEKQRLLDNEQRYRKELANELEVLRAQIEAESRSRALAHVATQVAHDIRSPLMALKLFLADGSAWKDAEKRQLCVNAIDRINGIATHLLNANREKDGCGLRAMPEPLEAHIDLVVAEKRTQAPGCVFRWEGAAAPASARVNAVGFQRVLSNLLDNAIDATDGRGTLAIQLLDSGEHYLVSVSDNGRGIPAHLLSRIGERGFTHGKARGNGLGLADAKEQVEKWDGTLSFNSREGSGSRSSNSVAQMWRASFIIERSVKGTTHTPVVVSQGID